MFENKNTPMISFEKFIYRSLRFILYALILLGISLGIGVFGYWHFGHLDFVDAFYNASMILTGMGPVDSMNTDAAKWFASFYALFSGVAFLTTVAVFFAPTIHRFLHKIHIDDND
ncbi:MAG TPA: hypothetical protein VFW11_12485 [Cyclobacteriaceae bacterium]|nr:hypothetical protein [Cyclobacteriaceae bacterium]